jgi:hypothetical protein
VQDGSGSRSRGDIRFLLTSFSEKAAMDLLEKTLAAYSPLSHILV